MREIRFFRSRSGRCPVEDFLETLTGKQTQKILWVLRLVEEVDPVPAQYLKKLVGTNSLWEVRVQHGGDNFRLLGFFDGPRLLILVSGFAKKAEKVPQQEIALAEQRRQDYLSRRREHERHH